MKIERHGQDEYLNEYTEYDKGALQELFQGLLGKLERAEAAGLKTPYVVFRSTLEPYEDCSLGPVEVCVEGYRPLTLMELAQEKENQRVEALAKELGVTLYEASVVDRLRKAGKV
jgi:hypothetical protein